MTIRKINQPNQPIDPSVGSDALAERLETLLGQMSAPKTIHNTLFAVEKRTDLSAGLGQPVMPTQVERPSTRTHRSISPV